MLIIVDNLGVLLSPTGRARCGSTLREMKNLLDG